jgi:hypothetical protein
METKNKRLEDISAFFHLEAPAVTSLHTSFALAAAEGLKSSGCSASLLPDAAIDNKSSKSSSPSPSGGSAIIRRPGGHQSASSPA